MPKASINAIRSGYPFNLTSAPQVCSFYVDTRILPGANPLDLRDELRGVLAAAGVEGTVELFLYRPGFEASRRGAARSRPSGGRTTRSSTRRPRSSASP